MIKVALQQHTACLFWLQLSLLWRLPLAIEVTLQLRTACPSRLRLDLLWRQPIARQTNRDAGLTLLTTFKQRLAVFTQVMQQAHDSLVTVTCTICLYSAPHHALMIKSAGNTTSCVNDHICRISYELRDDCMGTSCSNALVSSVPDGTLYILFRFVFLVTLKSQVGSMALLSDVAPSKSTGQPAPAQTQ